MRETLGLKTDFASRAISCRSLAGLLSPFRILIPTYVSEHILLFICTKSSNVTLF